MPEGRTSTNTTTGSKTQRKRCSTGSKTQRKRCSTCRNPLPGNYSGKTCKKCRKRAAENRSKMRKNKIECAAIKEDGTKCTFKVHKKCGNKYCEKHRKEWLEEKETGGKEVRRCNSRTQCDPKKPGIKAILPDGYTKKKCENCLKQDREKDKARRDALKSQGQKMQNKNIHICTQCPIGTKHKKEEMGVRNDGQLATLCKKHFEYQKKIEEARPKDRIRKDNRTPEQLREKGKKYRTEHPDRAYNSYTKYRERKLKEDPDGYRKKQAEIQRNRRQRLGLTKESSDRYKTNPKDKYRVYKRYAEEKGYIFDITLDEFKIILESDCYYCGCTRKKILNGIDRLDNTLGYIKGNIVPACKICNYMKNTLNEATFILMCMHIATVNKFYRTREFLQIFNNYNGVPYSHYKYRANVKKLSFLLSKEEFDELRNESSCYICKRYTNEVHCNGVDRIDNKLGYTLDNCKCCCGDCNYMKKNMDHDDFLLQCALIAYHHKQRMDNLVSQWKPSNHHNKNTNKLSSEEIEAIRLQKKKQREERTLESKSAELRAKKMEEIRKKKNISGSKTSRPNKETNVPKGKRVNSKKVVEV